METKDINDNQEGLEPISTIPAIVTHAMSYEGLQQHLKKEGRKDIGKGIAIATLGFIPFVGSLPDSSRIFAPDIGRTSFSENYWPFYANWKR